MSALIKKTAPRVVIIGGGLGATQVLDILEDQPGIVTGIVDDDEKLWGTEAHGLPVWGGSGMLPKLLADGRANMAVIAISTSIKARVILAGKCGEAGIPLATVIHRTAYVAPTADVGPGNIFCAFCHVGAHTKIGANNFFSAYNSFDHHNVVGSHCSTGPANAMSGIVTIGDRVRMGTGIQVGPHVHIGDDAFIYAGCCVFEDIPAGKKVLHKPNIIIQKYPGE